MMFLRALVFVILVWSVFFVRHHNASRRSEGIKTATETADSYWITPQDSAFLCNSGRGRFQNLSPTNPEPKIVSITLPSGLVINYKKTPERVSEPNGRTVTLYPLTPVKKLRVIGKSK